MLILRHEPDATHPWRFYVDGLTAGEFNRRDDAIRAWLWDLDPPVGNEITSETGRWHLGVFIDEERPNPNRGIHITYDLRDEVDAVQFRLRWS